MSMTTLKISEEALKKSGLNAAEFETGFLALIKENEKLKAESDAFAIFMTQTAEHFTALEAKIVGLEGRQVKAVLSDEDKTSILAAAKAEAKVTACSEVGAVIAKAGVQAMAAGGVPANDTEPSFAALVKSKQADPKLKLTMGEAVSACVKEFPAAYATWLKNPTAL